MSQEPRRSADLEVRTSPDGRTRSARKRWREFSHCGDAGDVLYAMPAVALMGGGDLHLVPKATTGHRMTPQLAASLGALLERQPYIRSVRHSDRVNGTDLDHWRSCYVGGLNLADMVCRAFSVPYWPRSRPWLYVDKPRRVAPVVFHRSERYRLWNFPWREVYLAYKGKAVFVGSPQEHAEFCANVGPVSYHHTPTYLDLARVIAGADLFVGNQSSPFAVAEGLKRTVILEASPTSPNCHWHRPGFHYVTSDSWNPPTLEAVRQASLAVLACHSGGRSSLADGQLKTLAELALSVRRVKGAVAEVGHGKGGTAAVLGACLPGKRLLLFDTSGEAAGDDVADFLAGHRPRFYATAFSDAVRNLPPTPLALVHVNTSSQPELRTAVLGLKWHLSPGGVMIFQTYGNDNSEVAKVIRDCLLPDVEIRREGPVAWFYKPATVADL